MQQTATNPSEDLRSPSSSSSTTTTAVDTVNRSTSSGSETTTWTAASAASGTSVSSSTNPRVRCTDPRREVIRQAKSYKPTLGLGDLRFIYRLGSGDIGSVYLVELKGFGGANFAAKVMDKKELAARSKEGRAKIEKGILEMLDHPFLPTLYATLECPRWFCLLTEFCPGGDLHVLRQRQPERRFHETAVRFYASEVIVALEYLHMMGVIYRDLKPENVLVRTDGHIMLTDFDLSLKSDNPASTMAQIVSDQAPPNSDQSTDATAADPPPFGTSSCILPNCIVPAVPCFRPKRRRRKKPSHRRSIASLEIVAEPVDVRSMSFVGTHEYLAPEIVSGEGHGSAVDWWTLGIFMFEMFYGKTPFKGVDNELTLANIVARALEFPKDPAVPGAAKDLIGRLLTKDPSKRMGSTMGATAVKHHPFFDGVNWALLRCTKPPYTPRPVNYKDLVRADSSADNSVEFY
ncbi:serine/threonine-protein kinase D6PKL1-like [Punica granatum]|uniref:non-specific serine/threonine protein kinase n=1 Tax=Punica granatum TaxID=22663 RepID=A0A218XRQ4_PUNGR|nr:serine/threonine-protein kinase D6PKL1-like [Punica granatum]OWM87643.1 hypothetical protein CDL15_Pgr022756 [Punica granatum]